MNRAELVKQICLIEDKYKFYEIKIEDISIWAFFRPYIIEKIMTSLEGANEHPDLVVKYSNFKKNLDLIFNSIFRFNYKKYKDIDNLLYFCLRKRKNENGYYAPLISPIVDSLENNYLIIERAMPNSKHLGFGTKRNVIFSDKIEVLRAIGLIKYKKSKLAQIWYNEIKKMVIIIEEELKIDIVIPSLYSRCVHILSTLYFAGKKIEKILKYINPKNVLISPNYELNSLVLIFYCHKLNIKVFELQHGYIGPTHYGYNYNFDYEKFKSYYPDKILVFGQYWKDLINIPNKDKWIIPVGFPEFEINSKELKIDKYSKNILFISESNGSHRLSKICLDFANNKLIKDYKIFYKMHPSECSSWQKLYPELLNNPKIIVIDTMDKSVYQYFSESLVVVGVDSTVLYESLGFGLTTCILKEACNSPLKEIKSKKVKFFYDSSDLIKCIYNEKEKINYEENNKIDNYFFQTNSVNNILKQLE